MFKIFKFLNNSILDTSVEHIAVFNPCDVKSIAMALYEFYNGRKCYSITSDVSFILNGNYKVKYLGFSMDLIDAKVVERKGSVSYSISTEDVSMLDIADKDVARAIYNLWHFNDKNASKEILMFVYCNIDNIMDYISGYSELELKDPVYSDSKDYLACAEEVKKRLKNNFEKLYDGELVDSMRYGILRGENNKEKIIAARLVQMAGYKLIHQQATSIGLISCS